MKKNEARIVNGKNRHRPAATFREADKECNCRNHWYPYIHVFLQLKY